MPVPVALGPQPVATFLNNSGQPLAGGKVFTYAAGTSTQQPTYTDSTGTIQNSNPIILDAAGRAQIWFSSLAYKIVVQDQMGVQLFTVDNFLIGVFANGNNSFTGNETHSGTETFNGPLVVNNGGALNGTFSGNPNFSGSPIFNGLLIASQFQSTVASGTPPIIVSSNTVVPNLNVETVNGVVFGTGGSVGFVPNIISANNASWVDPSTIVANGGFKVAFTEVSNQQVANTLTETTLYTFSTFANELSQNQILRLYMAGLETSVAGDGSLITYRVRVDGTQILNTGDGTAQTRSARGFSLETKMGFGTTGSSHLSVVGGSYITNPDGADSIVATISGGNSNGQVAFDQTIPHTFTVTAQWSAGVTASEFTIATLILVERLG